MASYYGQGHQIGANLIKVQPSKLNIFKRYFVTFLIRYFCSTRYLLRCGVFTSQLITHILALRNVSLSDLISNCSNLRKLRDIL